MKKKFIPFFTMYMALIFILSGCLTDSNMPKQFYFPPVFEAIASDNNQTLVSLIAQGEDVNQVHIENLGAYALAFTPLIYASAHNKIDAVKILLEAGAKLSLTDWYEPSDPKVGKRYKNSALHCAAANGFTEIVSLLIAAGANVNQKNTNGTTPLMVACGASLGNSFNILPWNDDNLAATAQLLIAAKAKINAVEYPDNVTFIPIILPPGAPKNMEASVPSAGSGQVPLHIAAANGLTKTVKVLLDNGANVNEQLNGKNGTPLYLAVKDAHLETATLLLDHKAKIELADPLNNTPFLLAVQTFNLPMVKLLVKRGANIHASFSTTGSNALMLAINQMPADMQQRSIEMMKYLVEIGLDVNFQGTDGNTALMWACGLGVSPKSTEKAAYLISKGANVNLQNKKGETALYHAADRAYTDLGKLLLSFGANPNLATVENKTPLMATAAAIADYKLTNTAYPAFVELLLNNGASVHAKDKNNITVLSYAIKYGSSKSQSLIKAKGGTVDASEKPDPTISQLTGTWTGTDNFFNFIWKFGADGSWSYNVEYSKIVLDTFPVDSREITNKELQKQQGGQGSFSVRGEWLLLSSTRIVGWQVRDGKLYLNGIQWVCTKK